MTITILRKYAGAHKKQPILNHTKPKSTSPLKQAGFTIIELMVATTVFSFVLLICTYGIIKVGNDYYKGITEARTQENARDIMDRITQDIQFSGGKVISLTTVGVVRGFCIGSHRYSFMRDKQLTTNHVMVVDTVTACDSSTPVLDVTTLPQNLNDPTINPALASPEELMTPNVRIMSYDTEIAGTTPPYDKLVWPDSSGATGVYSVGFRLIYGEDDLLNAAHDGCAGGAGIQFCAVSTLLSTVQQRVNAN